VCALWPAARRRLVWLTLLLALGITALTPITTDAGEWLYDLRRDPSPILREHADLGGWMIYFSVALLVVALLLAALHVREVRSGRRWLAANVVVLVVALAVGISSIIQVYRIGDAGAQSVWGGEIANLEQKNQR
jgi:membrane protein required for beta-lactamase induction